MARTAKGEGSIYRDGAGWRASVTIDGQRKTVRAKSKAEAAQKRRELLNRIDDGTLVPGRSHTVQAWLSHWLDNIAELAPYTRSGYRQVIRHYILPSLGDITLDKLQPEHLEKLYDAMRTGTLEGVTKPLAPATIRQVHAIMRRSLKIASQRGHVGRNVALLVEPPKVPKQQTEALSVPDVMAILEAAKSTPDQARWTLALLLGLRPGEVTGLTWDCVNFEKSELYVRQQLQPIAGEGLILRRSLKTGAGTRTIPLPEFIVDMLQAHRQRQLEIMVEEGTDWLGWEFDGQPVALVFPRRNGRPRDPSSDNKAWAELLSSAGISHTRRYTARHTAATIMLDQIGDVAVVAATLGHTDPSFTYRTYVHPMEDKKQALADKLSVFAPGS